MLCLSIFLNGEKNYTTTKNTTSHLSNIRTRDVEAFKFLMFLLPAPLEVLCFRVRFRLLIFGIFCFRFRLRIELVASEFVSASSLFHQSASASTKT